MVRSMTGFGKAACEFDGSTISVELSSVNHRFLDSNVRIPSEWSALDSVLREALKEHLSRGKVNVTISRKRGQRGGPNLTLDTDVAQKYVDASRELGKMLGTDGSISVDTLAQFGGVFTYEEEEADLEAAQDVLLRVLHEALDGLDAMRATEGQSLCEDLRHRVELIRESMAAIEERLPELNERYTQKLRDRIHELNDDAKLTEDRIGLEVALMAEKGDVTEEVVRLRSHLSHADELLASGEPVGRQLNFLAQEVQREINTLGSKVRDTDVVRQVLAMKSELEKFREQIQNIE